MHVSNSKWGGPILDNLWTFCPQHIPWLPSTIPKAWFRFSHFSSIGVKMRGAILIVLACRQESNCINVVSYLVLFHLSWFLWSVVTYVPLILITKLIVMAPIHFLSPSLLVIMTVFEDHETFFLNKGCLNLSVVIRGKLKPQWFYLGIKLSQKRFIYYHT